VKTTCIIFVGLILSTVCFGHLPTDLDGDGSVTFFDFGMFANQWQEEDPNDDNGYIYLQEMFTMSSAVATRRPYAPILPIYIDCFDDSSYWTDLHSVAVQDVYEFNGERAYLCGDKNFSSILITTLAQSGSYNYHHMVKTFDTLKDFSFCHISCRLKVPQGNGPAHISNIHKIVLRFIDDENIFIDYTLSRGRGDGWKETVVTQDDNDEGSNDIDWTRIKKTAIVIFTKESSTPQVIMDRLMIFRYQHQSNEFSPIVINTFDDTLLDQYDAAAYLSAKGMVGTFYTIGRSVGGDWGTVLTLRQLQDMYWAGHLIANHTWEHPMPFDALSPQEQIYQILQMQQWMCENGFGDGARIIATPGNVWNPQMDTYLRPYYSQIRAPLSGGGVRLNPLFDKTHLRVSASTPALAKAQVKKMLNNPNPSVMVYMGHGMQDYMTEFKEYIDYLYDQLQKGNLRVYNSSDLLNL